MTLLPFWSLAVFCMTTVFCRKLKYNVKRLISSTVNRLQSSLIIITVVFIILCLKSREKDGNDDDNVM